jgi:adenylate cyclase
MSNENSRAVAAEQALQILDALEAAVALVDRATWSLVIENAKFSTWFPGLEAQTAQLSERMPLFQADLAARRLDHGRPFKFETETRHAKRALPVRVHMYPFPSDRQLIVVECHDISKEKQTEYMLDSYSKAAEQHARELGRQKKKVENLLLNIMPRAVYEELTEYGITTPHLYESASIVMLDFVRFTSMSVSQDPSALVTELNDIFTAFDRIVETFGCERIRTIGDSYMAVSGIPESIPDHAYSIAKVALRMRRYLERRNAVHAQEWRCRFGINTGPVVGALVGVQKYVYDLFGPGVNLAARMESLSEPMRITVCEETYELLRDHFAFVERGEFDIKGFGRKKLYFLESELETRD